MNLKSTQSDTNNGSSLLEDKTFSIVDLIDNLFYFRWHFIVTFFLVTLIAVVYAVISTPIYSADVLIQVEERKGTSLGALTQVANALGAQQSPVLGEIEILRSRSIIGRAVDALKANIEVEVDNRVPILGNWLSRILKKDSDGLSKPLWASSMAWGGEILRFDELAVPKSLWGVPLYLTVGESQSWKLAENNGVVLAHGKGTNVLVAGDGEDVRVEIAMLRARAGTRFRITVYSIQSRVIQILEKFSAIEAKRQSNILRLTYENASPGFSAIMLNEIADTYVQQNISKRSEEAELSLRFLEEELPKLRIKLDASERALNEFRSKSKTMDITSEIKELLTQTTSLERTRLELDLKRREYTVRYDSSHPVMQALMSQLSGINAQSTELARQIGRLPLVEQDYIRLARDVQGNNQLYGGLLNNAQQLQIVKAGTTGNVAIVDRAVPPERPLRPKKSLIAAVGALLGLIFGFIICQALAIISKVVRDPKKLELETGLPTLAVIPLDDEQMEISIETKKKSYLLSKEKPNASSVEAIRSLRTSVAFLLSEKSRSKVVLITSAVPSQGKSFISVNLCYLIAATGKKVLLIEADIRLASARNYIEYDTTGYGLSTVLKDNIPVDSVILRDVFPNMDYLPAGPTVRNPGDLLAADAMFDLINNLAEQYDYVLIDSPPLLPVHDARSLGRAADVTLFVARQDAVSIAEVHDGIDVFSKAGNQIDGLVFNGFIPSSLRYGYGYAYGYAKYSRYKQYGQRYGVYNGYKRYGKYGKYGD